ncbi:MAG: AraC family transcriptional regulator [Gemmatimonadota bacterium]|nr:AraC family transcriptional regulator [Gemmatimonadota bacterium]
MKSETRHPKVLEGLSLRRVRYLPGTRQCRHHHDRTSLTLVFEGSLDEVVGRTREQAGPLSLVYKPAGTEHANQIGPAGAATLQIAFDPEFLPVGEDGPESWGWAHGGQPATRFLALLDGVRRGEGDAAELEALLFDAVAGLSGSDRTTSTRPPRWLGSLVEELEDTYRAPRSVRHLAERASKHPVAVARAHRRHYGCSITDRLRARRVREAAARLGTGESLSSIAHAAGFSDQAHMTRLFKRETGVTPGVFRSFITY